MLAGVAQVGRALLLSKEEAVGSIPATVRRIGARSGSFLREEKLRALLLGQWLT